MLPANEVGCVTMATVTSSGARLILADAGVTLTIPEGALKAGQVQEFYLASLREDRYRPKIAGTHPPLVLFLSAMTSSIANDQWISVSTIWGRCS